MVHLLLSLTAVAYLPPTWRVPLAPASPSVQMQMPQTAPPAVKLQKRDAAVDDGTMRWYLSSIGTRRLLDREEEIRLAMAIKELLGIIYSCQCIGI